MPGRRPPERQLAVDEQLARGVQIPAVLLSAFEKDFIQAVLLRLNLPRDAGPRNFPVVGAYVVQGIAGAAARRGGGGAAIRLGQKDFPFL